MYEIIGILILLFVVGSAFAQVYFFNKKQDQITKKISKDILYIESLSKRQYATIEDKLQKQAEDFKRQYATIEKRLQEQVEDSNNKSKKIEDYNQRIYELEGYILDLEKKVDEDLPYLKNFISEMLVSAYEANEIFRFELVKTIGTDSIPQYRELNKALVNFRTVLEAFIDATTKMDETIRMELERKYGKEEKA